MKNERTVYTTRGCFPCILFSSCNRKNENGYNGSYFYFSFFVWGLEKRKRMLSYPFSIFYYEIEKRKTKGRYIHGPMNSALLVNLTCISAKLSVKSPGRKAQLAAIGVIWISAGNWLTVVTSISRHDLLSWHRPHTKNVKSFCNYVMAIDVNQFGSFICYNY